MKERVLHLRPTQIAVGMKEVHERVKKLRGMKAHELEAYLKKWPAPVVLGPNGRVYLVDRHHHARACWEAGIGLIRVESLADFSKLSFTEFFGKLEAKGWLHLYDQFGCGPHDPEHLPENVRCLADDPYRSLAWMLRHAGGYEKSAALFSDFAWADFLRKNLKTHLVFNEYDEAVKEALMLAKSSLAAGLPGYSGRTPAQRLKSGRRPSAASVRRASRA